MNKKLTVILAVVGTALMSSAMPYAVTDLHGLMPQGVYATEQWWKTVALLGICMVALPVVWDRKLYPMPFALLGIACVAGALMAFPFVGMLAVSKLMVPYGGLCFGLAIAVFLYFTHLDPVEESEYRSEFH